jgi:hypothetical protein
MDLHTPPVQFLDSHFPVLWICFQCLQLCSPLDINNRPELPIAHRMTNISKLKKPTISALIFSPTSYLVRSAHSLSDSPVLSSNSEINRILDVTAPWPETFHRTIPTLILPKEEAYCTYLAIDTAISETTLLESLKLFDLHYF